jgi:hypothetical protein
MSELRKWHCSPQVWQTLAGAKSNDSNSSPAWPFLSSSLLMLPLLLPTYVALTRVMDYWHFPRQVAVCVQRGTTNTPLSCIRLHSIIYFTANAFCSDIIAGCGIGILCAFVGYCSYYRNPFSKNADETREMADSRRAQEIGGQNLL